MVVGEDGAQRAVVARRLSRRVGEPALHGGLAPSHRPCWAGAEERMRLATGQVSVPLRGSAAGAAVACADGVDALAHLVRAEVPSS